MNDYSWLNEQWADLDEEGFPNYAVSDYGRVARKDHDHILTPAKNQRGIRFVTLYHKGMRKQVMVSTLVAQHFLEDPPNEHMISVLHKDGDRDNNRADNLVWRPRWYINKYLRQFAAHDPYLKKFPITAREIIKTEETVRNSPMAVRETGKLYETHEHIQEVSKTYETIREAAVAHGVMAQDVEEAVLTNGKVRFAQNVIFELG